MIIRCYPQIDWSEIKSFSIQEKGIKHYLIMSELMNRFFEISFPRFEHSKTLYQRITYPLQKNFRLLALHSTIKKRSIISRFLDGGSRKYPN